MIIAIDGPSGAGKSTLGRLLARELNLLYIDTGAMYRAAALAVIESGVSTTDEGRVAEVVGRADINLEGDPDSLQVMLDGRDISEKIRTEEVSQSASVISAIPEVRRTLVRRQREMGERAGGVVLDGRDIGTVVFPSADVKFFLTAAPEARAQRRYEEDRLKERDATFEETLAEINTRDRRDSTRDDSPLVAAPDAVVIDSTDLSIEEVFERMIATIRERKGETRGRGDAETRRNRKTNMLFFAVSLRLPLSASRPCPGYSRSSPAGMRPKTTESTAISVVIEIGGHPQRLDARENELIQLRQDEIFELRHNEILDFRHDEILDFWQRLKSAEFRHLYLDSRRDHQPGHRR
jgi:CMP/dCMP kinase